MSAATRPPAVRRYGQNHLVDRGTLEAIVDMIGATERDVALEVGAADGVLTRPLLARAAAVHAYEIDRRFALSLERLAAEEPSLHVHVGDALDADLAALEPPPTLFTANLAYNIAIPMIVKSVRELPTLRRWAVMVQKELGERLFAAPRTKAYSAVSVIVQLACVRVAVRAVPRTVFSPRPRVDSQFVVFDRRDVRLAEGERMERPAGPSAPMDEVERLIRTAFGQRRKMLATSLAGTPAPAVSVAAGAGVRRSTTAQEARRPVLAASDVKAALQSLGLSERARPEELSPDQFVDLASILARSSDEATDHATDRGGVDG